MSGFTLFLFFILNLFVAFFLLTLVCVLAVCLWRLFLRNASRRRTRQEYHDKDLEEELGI